MTKLEKKERLLNTLKGFSYNCKKQDWDGNNADPINDDTINHGFRFINKLDKYDLIVDFLSMNLLSDGNLSFEWKLDKPKKIKFNIDFNKDCDNLMWCFYSDNIEPVYGSVLHLEQILPYIKKIILLPERTIK